MNLDKGFRILAETPAKVGVGPTYVIDGGMCPPYHGYPWMKGGEPLGLL